MRAWGVTEEQVRAVARAAGCTTRDVCLRGKAVQFVLALDGERYRRLTPIGRRVAAVCWHGHRAFFRALFAWVPGARVQTALTRRLPKGERFYTRETFETRYALTDVRVRSGGVEVNYSQCCICGEAEQGRLV